MFTIAQQKMVREQIVGRGIRDERVLDAMLTVPRHAFVDKGWWPKAYFDNALPIGDGQTISQPFMVAAMSELLGAGPHDKVLEVGTGSGYQTAVLRCLSDRIYTVERMPDLMESAKKILETLGLGAVQFMLTDGTLGWPAEAPFDRIMVTAAGPEIPEPLFNQLAEGGRLVVPVGNRKVQRLMLVEKISGARKVTPGMECVFVPLIGSAGWEGEV